MLATRCCSQAGYPNPRAHHNRGERYTRSGGACLSRRRLPHRVAQKMGTPTRAHNNKTGASGHDRSGGACLSRRRLPQWAAPSFSGGACHKVLLRKGTPTRAHHTRGEHCALGRRRPLGRRLPHRAAPSSPDGACHQVLLRKGYPSPRAHLTARRANTARAAPASRAALATWCRHPPRLLESPDGKAHLQRH